RAEQLVVKLPVLNRILQTEQLTKRREGIHERSNLRRIVVNMARIVGERVERGNDVTGAVEEHAALMERKGNRGLVILDCEVIIVEVEEEVGGPIGPGLILTVKLTHEIVDDLAVGICIT